MKMEDNIIQVPVESIIPNRFQPRLQFDEEGLKELSESIRQHGIIQPLVLRRLGDKYEIVAGERRYKASQMAGLKTVPAVISDIDDNASAEIALVENIQRRNLSSIEEAKSYKKLLDRGYMTQEQLADKLGVSQSSISNKMRLLNLAPEVQDALLNQKISERHARSLLNIPIEEQSSWLNRIIRERLTVRQLDTEIKKIKGNSVEDIPLIKEKKDFNDMISNAVDLNITPPKEETKPEIEEKKEPFIIPNKFFNFLEDESANMQMPVPDNNYANNTINENIETLDVLLNDNQASPQPKEEPVEPSIEETTPTFDPMNQVTTPTFDQMNQDTTSTFDQMNQETIRPFDFSTPTPGNNTIEEIVPEEPKEEFIDPMDSVIKLDPNYNTYVEKENHLDLPSAISDIRSLIEDLNNRGYVVTKEEIDIPGSYQITINIQKND